MQIKFEVLKKGDEVLNVWEGHIAVKRKNGDVEILQYYVDNDGLPRLDDNSVLITYGKGSVTAKSDNSSVEITTF